MTFTILVVKESRAGEQRVALVPDDVAKLSASGHTVYIEADAGVAAGFSNESYQQCGATIRTVSDEQSVASYRELFTEINLLVRAKRPTRSREQLEAQAIAAGTIMIGALDPRERGSAHMAEYQQAGIIAYSLDQLQLPSGHPMNLLALMSNIAGRLALIDALEKSTLAVKRIVIIGFGVVGHAAWTEALKRGQAPVVVLTSKQQMAVLTQAGSEAVLLDRQASLEAQRQVIAPLLSDADIVIASARRSGEQAPVLISTEMLQTMKPGCVVVDMAVSEGGNVAGSRHDGILTLAGGVIVTNVSGYPKVLPHGASIAWSGATLQAIYALEQEDAVMDSCLVATADSLDAMP